MKTGVKKRPSLLAGEDLPADPRQKRSLKKRARLKASGLALFAERGFEDASVDDIARRAKLAVGGFYQHFRSKRQLLLVLMDERLEKLSRLDLRPQTIADTRTALRELLARAFSHDLHYLGAYRAWQEAVLSDADLARKQRQIHAWTTTRVIAVFKFLQQLPGARSGVDIPCLARAMDTFSGACFPKPFTYPRSSSTARSIQRPTLFTTHCSPIPSGSSLYSQRSATSGSTLLARRPGM
jgi:AcrR family transcriptional regulator